MTNTWLHQHLSGNQSWIDNLPGQKLDWLSRRRQAGKAYFMKQGFPEVREEAWKYTRIAPITAGQYNFPEQNSLVDLESNTLEPFLPQSGGGWRLVFINGHFMPHLSSDQPLPTGVMLTSLANILETMPEQAETHLARIVPIDHNGFTALNTASILDGTFLHVTAGTILEEVIHLLYLTTDQSIPVISQPRNLLLLEHDAQAVVLESHASLGEGCHFSNAVTEVVLEDHAQLSHHWIQNENHQAFHVANLTVQQKPDSRLVSNAFILGAALCRADIHTILDGTQAECNLNGFYLTDGQRLADFHTRIDHAKPHARSQENYRGILTGRSRGVFNGKVVVHPGAAGTDARQTNANLLLSLGAEVDTKPELEIYADEVKCAHGATIGRLDPEALFYLNTRGLSKETAQHLLTMGFAEKIVEQASHPAWQTWIRERIHERLLPCHDVV